MHLCNKPRRKSAGAAWVGGSGENAFISARYLKVSLKDDVSQMLTRDIVRRKNITNENALQCKPEGV